MRVLIADDDSVSRIALVGALEGWGHQVVVAGDGNQVGQLLLQGLASR